MSGGVIAPVVPQIVEQLDYDPVLAPNLVSIHYLTIALFSLPFGILADKWGAVRVLIPSLVLYGIFGVSGAFTSTLALLLTLRALMGVACGGIAAASLGLLGRMYEGEARSRAIAMATSALTLSGIAFPILGGLLGSIGWQYAFGVYAIAFPIAGAAVVVFRQPFSRRRGNTTSPLDTGAFQTIGRSSQFWQLLLLVAIVSATMTSVIVFAPLYLSETIGADGTLNGIVLALRALGAAIASAFVSKPLAKRISRPRTIAIGIGLMAIALVTLPWLRPISLILSAALLFGGGFGLALPNLYDALAAIAPQNLKSSVLAAGTGAGFLGQFATPFLLGPLTGIFSLDIVFYVAAAVALGGGAFGWMRIPR